MDLKEILSKREKDTANGPKDMDSFGLSLLIKKSVISWLQSQSGKTCSGIVKITPEYLLYLTMDHEVGSDKDGMSTVFEEAESVPVGELISSPVSVKMSHLSQTKDLP
ncbi:Pyridoxal phosphate (PLP)-dependent transferases superfamily protein [Raphanus sativus]|nr:Pyridoxal phosphate (PLP)-dependent transferases superfamily protein [Raphanus sativus]KAJ4891035.1 Pyridoxal phosphate (PLP)-dependent transferases superfamily protein [Raphanus sativus]